MIDTEVLRLRTLRNVALRTRVFAQVLDEAGTDCTVYGQSAVTCWAVARIATGRLQAHPYESYQKGPSRLRDFANRAIAALATLNARRAGRFASLYLQELQALVRRVNDARALTLSAELSDALGRTQVQLRRMCAELDARARHEAGNVFHGEPQSAALQEIAVDSNWPYLAI